MGRHGGGSRSGGSRSGGSRGSSRSGGGSRGGSGGNSPISTRISKTSFAGAYDRSYYSRGKFHPCYTTDFSLGLEPGWNIDIIGSLFFMTLMLILIVSAMVPDLVSFGSKVDGDSARIKIVDEVDILTNSEELEVLALFNKVYEKSGMPVTLYTDDFDWKEHYRSLEVYAEELYYQMGLDEDAMIILFTSEMDGDFWDWEYDMYCGDDTIKCLSDPAFDKLLSNFHKAMATQDLAKALDYAWDSVIDELARITFNIESISDKEMVGLIVILSMWLPFYIPIIKKAIQGQRAYNYLIRSNDFND